LEATTVGGKFPKAGKADQSKAENGILVDRAPREFIQAIAQHRFWERELVK